MYITKAMRIFAWCTTCIPSCISLKQHVERYSIIFREKPGAALHGRSPPNRHQCSANLFQQDTCVGTICVSSTSFIRHDWLKFPRRVRTPLCLFGTMGEGGSAALN